MKQIGLAFQMYLNDNKGIWSQPEAVSASRNQFHLLGGYMGLNPVSNASRWVAETKALQCPAKDPFDVGRFPLYSSHSMLAFVYNFNQWSGYTNGTTPFVNLWYIVGNSFRMELETVLTNCPECAKSDCKSCGEELKTVLTNW